MSNKRSIEIKERMYLLYNITEENDFKICKLKSWGSYRMIPLREVKNSSYRFNPNSEYKHLLGIKWDIVFREELDIGYIDVGRIIGQLVQNSHKIDTTLGKNKKKERRYEKHERETQKEYMNRMVNQIEETTEYETD